MVDLIQQRWFLVILVGCSFSTNPGVFAFVPTATPSTGSHSTLWSTAPLSSPESTSTTSSKFTADDLFSLSKDFLNNNGFYGPVEANRMAEDFVFRSGIVGPLNKQDYCTTMTKLGVYRAFDLQSNAFGFCMDPDDEQTVRFYVRYSGRQVADWDVPTTYMKAPMPSSPSAPPVQGMTESFCLKFDKQGKVQFFSAGNLVPFGNPKKPTVGKYGAVFGLYNYVNQGFRVDWALMKPNIRKLGNWAAQVMGEEQAPPRTKSDTIPDWWNEH